MKRIASLALASSFFATFAQAGTGQPESPAIAAGTPYAVAREELLREQALPKISETRSIGCVMEYTICRVYPELEFCSLGQHFCRFEWLAPDGRPFAVITTGQEVASLTVQ